LLTDKGNYTVMPHVKVIMCNNSTITNYKKTILDYIGHVEEVVTDDWDHLIKHQQLGPFNGV